MWFLVDMTSSQFAEQLSPIVDSIIIRVNNQSNSLMILLGACFEKILKRVQRRGLVCFLQDLLILLSLDVFLDCIDTCGHFMLSPAAFDLFSIELGSIGREMSLPDLCPELVAMMDRIEEERRSSRWNSCRYPSKKKDRSSSTAVEKCIYSSIY